MPFASGFARGGRPWRGQLDPVHPDAALAEGQREPAGADAELEGGARPCQVREEADGRLYYGGLEQFRPLGLVGRRYALIEIVLSHRATVAGNAATRDPLLAREPGRRASRGGGGGGRGGGGEGGGGRERGSSRCQGDTMRSSRLRSRAQPGIPRFLADGSFYSPSAIVPTTLPSMRYLGVRGIMWVNAHLARASGAPEGPVVLARLRDRLLDEVLGPLKPTRRSPGWPWSVRLAAARRITGAILTCSSSRAMSSSGSS